MAFLHNKQVCNDILFPQFHLHYPDRHIGFPLWQKLHIMNVQSRKKWLAPLSKYGYWLLPSTTPSLQVLVTGKLLSPCFRRIFPCKVWDEITYLLIIILLNLSPILVKGALGIKQITNKTKRDRRAYIYVFFIYVYFVHVWYVHILGWCMLENYNLSVLRLTWIIFFSYISLWCY